MEQKLSPRREKILRIVVSEHIDKGSPVASESIARNYPLEVSSATIRNEMAHLEEEGYLIRPHTSAGSIPSDKGYRHYVDSLGAELELSAAEQQYIRLLFQQVAKELEEWVSLTAGLVARLIQNITMVTPPKAAECRFHHLELVALQEFLALLILVLREAKIRQQLLAFDQATSQEELDTIAKQINAAYYWLSTPEILAKKVSLPRGGEQVTEALVGIMQEEDEAQYEEPYLEGLHFMLSQPEFSRQSKMLDIIGLVEEKSLHKAVLSQVLDQGVQVIIGGENKEAALRDFSVVTVRYGIPEEFSGAIGVVGPRRMRYPRVIATVNYLSSLLSEITAELYRKELPRRTSEEGLN